MRAIIKDNQNNKNNIDLFKGDIVTIEYNSIDAEYCIISRNNISFSIKTTDLIFEETDPIKKEIELILTLRDKLKTNSVVVISNYKQLTNTDKSIFDYIWLKAIEIVPNHHYIKFDVKHIFSDNNISIEIDSVEFNKITEKFKRNVLGHLFTQALKEINKKLIKPIII
jgi:hypothetical protein